MMKLILAVLMTVTISANADVNNANWMDSIQKVQDSTVYYEDENGYIQKWEKPKRYRDWTYTDENGYDYTIKIIIK